MFNIRRRAREGLLSITIIDINDIHPKNWLCLLENSAENSNFPQKDCLRTRKLSILQCVKKRSTGIFEDQSELKSLAEQVLGFRS